MMYYDDPITGRRISRSTKETTRKAAEKVAAKWEAELHEGRYKPKSNVTWEEFRESYLHEHLKGAPHNTFYAYACAFNALERHCKVNKLAELTSPRLQAVARKWCDEDKVSPATVATYLAHIGAALNWANKQEMLHTVPAIEYPRGSKGKMKGRPITLEEFERMLAKVETVLADRQLVHRRNDRDTATDPQHCANLAVEARENAPAWRRLLRGLWLSGLRIGEAVNLTWDDESKGMVDFSGKHPIMRIPAEWQKARRDTETPIVPDFYELLAKTPPEARHGLVFPVVAATKNSKSPKRREMLIGRIISAMGQSAGVKVATTASGKVKFASAHDLRRSFGTRWAPKVMPATLQQLMRHRNINTTMKYYVSLDAESTAATLWQQFGAVQKVEVE
jgi:integrase